MKKTILTILLSLSTVTAMAQTSVTILGGQRYTDGNDQRTTRTGLQVRTKFNSVITGDVSVINHRNDATRSTTTRQEAGIIVSVADIDRLALSIRGATGIKTVSGQDRAAYYSFEPRVDIKITPDLIARVAYRYRDAYSEPGDRSDTMRYSLTYALTKKDRIGFVYDDVRKDSAGEVYTFNYTRSF